MRVFLFLSVLASLTACQPTTVIPAPPTPACTVAPPPTLIRGPYLRVFAGHHYNYERNKVNGVTYIVTGGGGAPLGVMEEREPTRATFAVAYHVVMLEIDGDHLEATVFSVKGRVLDEFERTHH